MDLFIFDERVTGVEPVSLPWQGNIIAAIRYQPTVQRAGPLIVAWHFVPSPRIELGTQGFSVLCSTTELTRLNE